MTLGADGALLVTEGPATHVPPAPVTPLDTTGAGDAFIGSFAHFYAQSSRMAAGDVVAAMTLAARYAADSITKPGTQSAFATAAEFGA